MRVKIEHAAGGCLLEQVKQKAGLVRVGHGIEHVRDGLGRGDHADLDRDRVLENLGRQVADILGHGGREEERLAARGDVLQDAANVGQEAHVAHAVRLVEHQDLHVGEIDVAAVDEVEQPAGTGNDDLGATAQGGDLGHLAHAAIDGHAAHLGLLAEADDGLVDLVGQLARGRHDEGAHLVELALGEALKDRQHKGGRLAGAGLCQAEYVFASQGDGDRLFLDRGRRAVARALDAHGNTRV